MILRILGSALLATALCQGAAYAANSNNSSTNNPQLVQTLPQQIKQKLQQDGFSKIQIVPGSFLVSARDKNGDPVEMVIRPNSMTVITESEPNNPSGAGSANPSNNSSSKNQ